VHTSCHPTLQHHNSYNRTDNYRQWNAVGSPDDGHEDARNMLRYYWLPINHYLLHLVGLFFTYLSKMHGHSNIKLNTYGTVAFLWHSIYIIVVLPYEFHYALHKIYETLKCLRKSIFLWVYFRNLRRSVDQIRGNKQTTSRVHRI